MTTNQNIQDLLSNQDKIEAVSDNAIRDIYSRQIILKIAKTRKGYVQEKSDLFQSLDVSKKSYSL